MKNGYQTDQAIQMSGRAASKERGRLRKKILTPGICSVAAGLGVFGGIAFLFAGLICVILHEIIPSDVVYNQVGTTLLISAIPMLLVGSVMIILTVFIAGLMVGRTPEYLGKKIESYDVQMAMLYVLSFPVIILAFSAVTVLAPDFGLSSLNNQGAHGLSEILYAFTSATGNNGSAFAGLNANTLWYDTTMGLAMLIGRFLMIVPVLAIAGNLARKKLVPATLGTFPVNTALFSVLLVSVVLILGALTFFPVLSLSPILEHFQMVTGRHFTTEFIGEDEI